MFIFYFCYNLNIIFIYVLKVVYRYFYFYFFNIIYAKDDSKKNLYLTEFIPIGMNFIGTKESKKNK
jgi:hypothetical protein